MEHSLYIHIPFCKKKCNYCDFVSYSGLDSMQEQYIDALIAEMASYRGKRLRTVYMGGGTPTCMDPRLISAVFEALKDYFDTKGCIETSVEANPGTLSRFMLRQLKRSGVQRLSIGLQSWNEDELKMLGRIHRIEEFVENYKEARDVGFDNINVDLIFGVPGQTMNSWKDTLRALVDLNPEHVSCYSLKIEEGTKFYRMLLEGTLAQPDQDLDREMYHYAVDFLEKSGYRRYEISNFALEGRECLHNLAYWDNRPYIGVGVSAHSYTGRVRRWNVLDIHSYCNRLKKGQSPLEDSETLSQETKMFETIFLKLRTRWGIDFEWFEDRFGVDIRKLYSRQLEKLKREGLIELDRQGFRLTTIGMDLSNRVFIEFLR